MSEPRITPRQRHRPWCPSGGQVANAGNVTGPGAIQSGESLPDNVANVLEGTIAAYNYFGSTINFIVATEPGIIHQMELRTQGTGKSFIPAPPDSSCACNECPHMKLNTLAKLAWCLDHGEHEVTLSDEVRENILKMVPLKRMGEPEDIASMVGFLSGPSSGYITGQVFTVDGGMVM